MVLFTLTGLNVDVGLYEFIEYPTYDFPDVSASYYLDLSFNPIYFDNIFYFKTTNPDLNSNVRIEQRTITQLKDIAVTLGILDNSTVNDILTPRKYKTVIESLNNGTSRLLTADELNKYISTNGYITHLSDGTVVTETQLYSTTYSPLLPEIDQGTTEYGDVQTRNQYAWQNIAINSAGATNDNPKKETQNLYAETSTSWNSLYTQGNGRNLIQVYYSENIFLGVSGEQNLPDMAFKCESSNWPDVSFSEGVISNDSRSDINNYLPPPSANGVHYNKNIGVQWLAKNITGGYNNSDLFANEEALVQQYVDLDSSNSGISVPGIKELIKSTLDVSGGTDSAPLSNADIGRNNISREALLHLLDNDISGNVQRVHNMITNARTNVDSNGNDISFGDTSNLWIPIEFFDSDTIKFKLIYKPDQITDGSGVATDDSGNALGTNTIEDQDYVVRLNIVGYRSDLYLRSSFLSDLNLSSNNFSGDNLVDHIASRNSNGSVINDTTQYLDNNFGSYVKIGSTDTSYNYYKWSNSLWKKTNSNNNWVYSTIRQNSTTGSNVYFTWIYRLHDGGYNQSIETRPSHDGVRNPDNSWSTNYNLVWTPTQSGRIHSGGSQKQWLIDPQKYASFLSKQYGGNDVFSFGFFNGAYHMGDGSVWNPTTVLQSNMTSNTENDWRVLTLSVTAQGNSSAIFLFENGIFLGSMGNKAFLGNNSNTELFDKTYSNDDQFKIGLMSGGRGVSQDANNPSQESVSYQKSLPYDLALWEAHEELSNEVNISFKAAQIYTDYVNKYKYDFINGVST
jgi:hypothetical protein